MAYDRYDTRDAPRDERSRWSDEGNPERRWDRDRGRGGEDRGFFERAGDEIASWFGDDDAERRRRSDQMRDQREGSGPREFRNENRGWDRDHDRGYGRDFDRNRSSAHGRGDWGDKYRTSDRGGFSDRDYNRGWRNELSGNRDRDWSDRNRDRDYRPMAGDYGRLGHESEQFFAASGVGRGERGVGDYDRSQTPYGRDEYRRTSFAGSREGSRDRDFDPHYRSWRERHMSDLDRDYDDYRREHQSKFEEEFGSWREKRQSQRQLLGRVREHMEIVGSDGQHIGTVDKVRGDRIILTKSDPSAAGHHHSVPCSWVDTVDDKVIINKNAEEARHAWRDEETSRALFERDDQRSEGPHALDRSFSGTY